MKKWIKLNNQLVRLYRMFEKYETKYQDIRTVISIMNNDVILIVEPENLIKKLDLLGFKKYRTKLNGKYFKKYGYIKYTIHRSVFINIMEKIDDMFISDEGWDLAFMAGYQYRIEEEKKKDATT